MSIGFLGLGQCGGSICDVASREGFPTAVINYSLRDLESLECVENKLHLYGSEGVGKSRETAIQLMNSNWDLATNFVKQHFSHPSIELIFVPFSTAGGSGSGISPVLLSMLIELMPEKTFVAVPVIPDKTEVYKSQVNCLEAFEDLSQLDIAILPIDNEQVRTSMSNGGRVGLYRNTNEQVIKLIKDVIDYTEQPTQYSVIDKKDFLSIFKTKGFATISELYIPYTNEFETSETTLAETIQQSWRKSIFAQIENDQIISAGIIFDGEERLLECLNMRKVFNVFNNKMPLNLYEGIYSNHSNKIISILSGLPLCKSRLGVIESIVESQTNQSPINQTQTYVSKVKKTSVNEHVKKQPTTKDISSMISKFRR